MNPMDRTLADSITPERRFLLAASRLEVDAVQLERVAREVDDWDAVIGEGRRHHLLPLLARASKSCNAVPKDVRTQLESQLQMTRIVNAMYLDEAKNVLQTLHAHGLTPVVLKGVALAEALYGDIALRPFCDLDILFDRADIPEAARILRSMGYLQESSPHDTAWYFEHYYQLPRFALKGGRFCIELHWDLARRPNPLRIDMTALRERAIPCTVAGVAAKTLDREDMLCHLALHLAWGNGFDGHFRGLVDIAEIARTGVDWPLFERRVAAANAAQVVVPVLELAVWLLDAPIPQDTIDRIGRNRGGAIARHIVAIGQSRIFDGGAGHRTWMRLIWLRTAHERFTLLRQNFGSVEHAERDTRPQFGIRVLQGAQRAMSAFLPGRSRRRHAAAPAARSSPRE
jgi:hypothetical protein